MGYTLPTFNLQCNIYTNGLYPVARLTNVPCNLAWGRRVAVPSTGGTSFVGVPLMTMTLLLPLGTDVRGTHQAPGFDTIEVPAGSGRLYWVMFADNIGMGFPNEHKAAILQQQTVFKSPDV